MATTSPFFYFLGTYPVLVWIAAHVGQTVSQKVRNTYNWRLRAKQVQAATKDSLDKRSTSASARQNPSDYLAVFMYGLKRAHPLCLVPLAVTEHPQTTTSPANQP